jgi:hypothetical protein
MAELYSHPLGRSHGRIVRTVATSFNRVYRITYAKASEHGPAGLYFYRHFPTTPDYGDWDWFLEGSAPGAKPDGWREELRAHALGYPSPAAQKGA